jgi:uncharacterized cupredoxin-like copper-binding protein
MNTKAAIVAAAAALTVGVGVAGCGDDGDSNGEETASAEKVMLTTDDAADGFAWEVEPTPTADTKTISYTNNSKQPHALIIARLGEGFTLEEAYKLQGKKGSATIVAETDRKTSPQPGETVTVDVTKPIEPGSYAMFCPIPGHYQQGQLKEFEIE